MGDFLGQGGIMRGGCQLLLQRFHFLHGVQRRGEYQLHRGVNIQRRVQPGILLQIAGGHPGSKGGIARVWQALSAENPQQRGLSGAVCTNDTDAVTSLHTGIYILQYLVFAEALA